MERLKLLAYITLAIILYTRLTHDDKELKNKYANFVNFFSGDEDFVYSYADREGANGEEYELEEYYNNGESNGEMSHHNSRDEPVATIEKGQESIYTPLRKDGVLLPKFMIIGVMKCGTSAISKFLSDHPLLYDMGETYFFNRNYKEGYKYYSQFMSHYAAGQIPFEKTPTYYLDFSHSPERILQMNKNIKIIFVVCDNVRRVLSRFLHITSLGRDKKKIRTIGKTFDEFQVNLNHTVDSLNNEFETLRAKYPSDDDFFEAIENMLQSEFRSKNHPITKIISGGFYYVYHNQWKKYFKENFLTIDGSTLNAQPGKEMIKIQNFLGLEVQVDEDSFVYNPEREFYCLKSAAENCINSNKGRSSGRNFEPVLHDKLQALFKPFDDRMAQILGKTLDWKY